MIFVTVGTHEQSFNRLIEKVDELKGENVIEEEVIIQSGFSTYKPKNCKYGKIFSYDDMQKYVSEARIVITHGGPSSFIMPLQIGNVPIVVPRQKKYGEHVNDHQLEFCKAVKQRYGNIILVENIDLLDETITHYDELTAGMINRVMNNNLKFCSELQIVIDELMRTIK